MVAVAAVCWQYRLITHTADSLMPHVHVCEIMHDRLHLKTLGRIQASLPTVWTQQAAIAKSSVQTEGGTIHASANI